MHESQIVGVLLAAGEGRRFGGDKLLAPLPDGTSVGVAAARSLAAAVPEVVATVRPGDRRLAEALAGAGARVVECEAAAHGLGHSLACGVAAAADADGWVIALGDMPWIRPTTTREVARRLRHGARPVAPVHGGRRGHPVGFPSALGPALRGLRGDRGARALLEDHAERVEHFETADAGVLRDVDTRDAVASRSPAAGD